MRTNIKATKTTLTPSLRSYIEDKLVRPIEKLLKRDKDEEVILDIEVELTTRHHKKGNIWRAETNLAIGGALLRAEHFGEDPHEAIDLLEEEIIRELKNFKGKNQTIARRSARLLKKILRREKK